jgi:hypothetical protein
MRDPPFEGWNELDEKQKLKKWMLSRAIDRSDNNLSEKYAYMNKSTVIKPEQIISYEVITQLVGVPL